MQLGPLPSPPWRDAVRRLASGDPRVAESAREELVKLGTEALFPLIACLEDESEELRVRSISLLALIGDERATSGVAALLHDPSPTIRRRAAGALSRLGTEASLSALERLLRREGNTSVRVVAAHALVSMVQTGHEAALRPLMNLLSDPDEPARVRRAAIDALAWVSSPPRLAPARAMLRRLADDPTPALAQRARRLLEGPVPAHLEPWVLERLIRDLASPRLCVWRSAVTRLSRGGGAVVEPLVRAMMEREGDEEFARRAVLALRTLSPRQLARAGTFFDESDDPVVLGALVELAESAGSPSLLARVATLIRRIAALDPSTRGPLFRVRLASHLVLARAGSRLGVPDLVALLLDPEVPLERPLTEAVEAVGTRRELGAILEAYRRASGMQRLALRDAVIAMAQRERIRRRGRTLDVLSEEKRRALFEILGAPRRRALTRRLLDL